MTQKTYSKNRDRWQTSYGTSLGDVKGFNNRLKLLLSGGIRKVDPRTGEVLPLGRGVQRAIIDPIVDTARAGLRIAKPIVKGAYEELYVNPAKERRKEYQGKKKKYEDKTIDIKESELAGKEVTITEGKGLKIQRGKTKLQNETDIILDQNKGNTKKDTTVKNTTTKDTTATELPAVIKNADKMSKKKKDDLIINKFKDITLE